jgi:hypothetical protein
MIGLTILTDIYWNWLEGQLTLPTNLNSKVYVCHAQLPPYQQLY